MTSRSSSKAARRRTSTSVGGGNAASRCFSSRGVMAASMIFDRLLLRGQQRSRTWMAERQRCGGASAKALWRFYGGRLRRVNRTGSGGVAQIESWVRLQPDSRPLGQISPSSNCTATRSPAAQLPVSAESTMKQFACDIDDRIPEPWSPVVRTVNPPRPSGARMPRWNSVRPGAFRIGAASGTLNVGMGAMSRWP